MFHKEMNVHCFFEQSGTFKNEFKKFGFDAFDYDISRMNCKNVAAARSLIHPDYANRFIR